MCCCSPLQSRVAASASSSATSVRVVQVFNGRGISGLLLLEPLDHLFQKSGDSDDGRPKNFAGLNDDQLIRL